MPLTPEKIVQKIRETGFQEDIEVIPESPKTYWTDNIFTRTLTRLYGKGKTRYIPIEATEAGEIKVAVSGGGLDNYYTFPKATIADVFATKNFTEIVSKVDITVWTNPAIIQLSNDGVSFGADIYINPNTFYSVDQSIKSIKYKNGSAGNNAVLQLVGFY